LLTGSGRAFAVDGERSSAASANLPAANNASVALAAGCESRLMGHACPASARNLGVAGWPPVTALAMARPPPSSRAGNME